MEKADVFVVVDNIISPIGKTTDENFNLLKTNKSAVKEHTNRAISSQPFYASLFNKDECFVKGNTNNYTKFEQLLIASVEGAIKESNFDVEGQDTVLIVSSTKGNVSLLETEPTSEALKNRIALSTSAKLVAAHFKFANSPAVISNACISGVSAIITGMRLLRSGKYNNAVIVGADVISKFIFSGFESFQALSPEICRPFDQLREGLNLGEGAGTIILSSNERYKGGIHVSGGAVSNDANHISGPSRTGKELSYAINKSLQDADILPEDIDFISAHGTATIYNDEMEANAINLSGLQSVPVNSLKGYYGHTLGAAGLIESIISIQSLREGLVLPTPGFTKLGVQQPVNVVDQPIFLRAKRFLKTASGFGGCNAAVVFTK